MQLHGLYVITDSQLCPPEQLLECVEQALRGGAVAVQYREKSLPELERRRQAFDLNRLCQDHDALFLVNDDVLLARAVGAGGVHIGQDDMKLAHARELLGMRALIGVSCYNQLELAVKAEQQGADYVAFGRFFASRTKPLAVQADPALICQAKQVLRVPVVSIGGITADNGAPLVAAGADMLAVIQGVFGQNDIEAAARKIADLYCGRKK